LASIKDFFVNLNRIADASGVASVPAVAPVGQVSVLVSSYSYSSAKSIGAVFKSDLLSGAGVGAKLYSESQAANFKSIADFFVYLEKIKYLLGDSVAITPAARMPVVALSENAFTYFSSIIAKPGDPVGTYLESVLFPLNEVVIQEVPIGEMLEFEGMVPPWYSRPSFSRLASIGLTADMDASDGQTSAGDSELYADTVIHVVDFSRDEASSNGDRDFVAVSFQRLGPFVVENFGDEIVVPQAAVSSYAKIENVDTNLVVKVLPHVSAMDEMTTAVLMSESGEGPVISARGLFSTEPLNPIEVEFDDVTLIKVQPVNVAGFTDFDGLGIRFAGRWGNRIAGMDVIAFTDDLTAGVNAVPVGAFSRIAKPDEEQGGEMAALPSRAVSGMMDVEDLEIVQTADPVVRVSVGDDYEPITTVNWGAAAENITTTLVGVVSRSMSRDKADDAIAQVVRAAAVGAYTPFELEELVTKVETAAIERVKANYMDSEDISSGAGLGGSGEALGTNITPVVPIEEGDLHIYTSTAGGVFAGDDVKLNQYDPLAAVTVNVYPTSEITGELGLTLHEYERDRANVYTQTGVIGANPYGDDARLHEYVRDGETGQLHEYVRPGDDGVGRYEGEALITNISGRAETEVKITIIKRLELFLKWLYELSMKGSGGGSEEGIVASIRKVKKMVMDEPEYADAVVKGIKRVSEENLLDKLLKEAEEKLMQSGVLEKLT